LGISPTGASQGQSLEKRKRTMAAQLKVGNIVRLRSGGPLMTVTLIDTLDGALSAWCSWFDEKNKAEKDTFPVASLDLEE
jgi:uncharacterized protein YodC (DUF2158 family)